ncbi:MAG: TIGR02221 family CRISPR-associated protein [Prevotella sp.]
MARKLFISFLGTGNYHECVYYDSQKQYRPTHFIQCATLEKIGAQQWEETDAVRIFATKKAKEQNWNEKLEGKDYAGLSKQISDLGLKADIQCVSICDGKNETEMWDLFETVFSQIEEGDLLYVDLTHAFRYQPMLMLVLTNYAKFLKNIKVMHISYGNYEAGLTTAIDGKDLTLAPIVNLLQLSQLQDWTTAAADFLQNGYVDKMSELASNSIRLLQKDVSTRSDDNRKLASFVGELKTLVEERQTCRGLDISSGATQQKLMEEAGKLGEVVIKPLEPILEKVSQALPKPEGSLNNCLDAAQWCYDNHLYQQSATILQEGVVTYFSERHGIAIANEEERGLVNSAFNIKAYALPQSEWDVKPAQIDKVKELLGDIVLSQPSVYCAFSNITEIRNDYNHAGFRSKREPQSPANIKKNISKALQLFRDCLTDDYEAKAEARRVFVNLSNHPSADWSEEQKKAALVYGGIIDVPFPSVPSSCSDKAMQKLADKAVGAVGKAAYPAREVTVHVMGEMTLTYRIVNKLKARGIRCLASTSDRVANDLGNGEKISQFHFVEFREY